MTGGFRGHGQDRGRTAERGPVSQKQLLLMLRVLIDTSRGKAASRTRDEARRALRELLAMANWNTSYVLRNLGARRCRYLSGLGYPVPAELALRSDIERLATWSEHNG